MKRILAILAVLGAAAALLFTSGAGGDEGTYEVRAIFDNASFLVTAEDVRIAGAKVGSVADVDIAGADEAATEDGDPAPGKAVVVLRIDDPAFHDFRQDASCLIRPQSLIGEKFVECTPTEPRASGISPPPELEQIADGEPGEGQYLLPLERNGKAIDLDLVNNIMREPYPDRFRLILNDLGAGLAARGDELAEIVERANPALRETNKVLAILRQQNKALERLAVDGDAVMTALARERESVAGFINSSEVVGAATAERRAELEEGFAKLPGFLRELQSTMVELGRFSDAATPVFSDLGEAAPSLTRLNLETIPFSSASTGAVETLGTSAERSGPALVGADSVIRQIRGLAKDGAPASKNLKKLLASLRKTRGFEYFLETLFGLGGTVNSFDQYGHFVRTLIPTQNCFDYTVIPQSGCSAKFGAASLSASQFQRQLEKAFRKAVRALSDEERDSDQAGEEPGNEAAGDVAPESAPEETEAPPAEESPEPETEIGPATELDPPAAGDPATEGEAEVGFGPSERLLEFLIGDGRRGGSR